MPLWAILVALIGGTAVFGSLAVRTFPTASSTNPRLAASGRVSGAGLPTREARQLPWGGPRGAAARSG